jgi:hypothetical protein
MRLVPCAGLQFFIVFLVVSSDFFVSLSGEKFSSLLGPPSNEENAVEFQSVG